MPGVSRFVDVRGGAPGYVVADAPEAVGAGRLQGLQHRGHAVAQLQVGGADDGRRGPRLAVDAAGAGGRQPLHELHLAHGLQFVRARGAVHGTGFKEYRRPDVMAGVEIRHQLVQQVSLVRDAPEPPVPEVVVRIAKGNIRLKGSFLSQSQPVVISKRHVNSSRGE